MKRKNGGFVCKLTNVPLHKCIELCGPCFNAGECIKKEFDPEIEYILWNGYKHKEKTNVQY